MVPSYVAFLGLRATGLFPRQPLFAFASHLSPALLMAVQSEFLVIQPVRHPVLI